MSDIKRILHVGPEQLIELAYGKAPGASGALVSLRLVPSLDWLRVPVRVKSWTPKPDHRGATISIRWQATHLTRYFPVMEADLVVKPGEHGTAELLLDGRYRPPLGFAGLLVDRVIGRWAAAATAAHFIERLADEIERGGAS